MTKIDSAFLAHATNVLADTVSGLSGTEICKYCSQYASIYNISIPYPSNDIKNFPKKSIALRENLEKFSTEQQFTIIRDLCNLEKFRFNQNAKKVLLTLITQYENYAPNENNHFLSTMKDNVMDWLNDYPLAKQYYDKAAVKMEMKIYDRELLDSLRFSLEKLVNYITSKNGSLENKNEELGKLLKASNIKKEIRTLFDNVMKFYTNFNNQYVKHNKFIESELLDIIPIEYELIFNQTVTLMQFLVRLDKEQKIVKQDNKPIKLEIV